MSKFLLPATVLIVLFALFSCAGTPVEDNSAVEASVVEDTSAPLVEETVIVWKPAAIISAYVDGTVDKTVENTYSDNGQLVRSVDSDGRGNLLLEQSFEYKDGSLVKVSASDSTGLISMTLYNLNSDQQVETQVKQDPQGTVLSVVRFDYDGELVNNAVASDGSGVPLLITEYQYLDGQIAGVLYKTPSGTEEARFERILENGMIIREQTVLPDGSIETARDYLYENGMNVEIVHYAGDLKVKTTAIEYDEYGNSILEVWSDRNGKEYSVMERSWIQFEEIK